MQLATLLDPRDYIAISSLLTELSVAVDDRDPTLLSTLVTDDVVFDVGQGEIQGRAALIENFGRRAADFSYVARHLWSNLRVEAINGHSIDLRCAFATFAVTDLEGARNRVWRCGDYYDVVRRSTEGGWLLASRKLVLALPD